MVQSVPGELSLQETSVLTAAANSADGSVTKSGLMKALGCVMFCFKIGSIYVDLILVFKVERVPNGPSAGENRRRRSGLD